MTGRSHPVQSKCKETCLETTITNPYEIIRPDPLRDLCTLNLRSTPVSVSRLPVYSQHPSVYPLATAHLVPFPGRGPTVTTPSRGTSHVWFWTPSCPLPPTSTTPEDLVESVSVPPSLIQTKLLVFPQVTERTFTVSPLTPPHSDLSLSPGVCRDVRSDSYPGK